MEFLYKGHRKFAGGGDKNYWPVGAHGSENPEKPVLLLYYWQIHLLNASGRFGQVSRLRGLRFNTLAF